MSDGNENNKPMNFEEITKSPFFTFSKSYLDFITKGKVFSIVYFVMAAINLLLPFIVLYMIIDSGVFQYGDAKFIFAAVLSWLVFVFACWIGFQVWFNRRNTIAKAGASQFVVTVLFSELFQTAGEWIGTMVGIIGAGVGLIATIFLGDDANDLFRAMGIRANFMGLGLAVVIVGPVVGALIIIVSRFIAEQLRMFAQLVNNTGDIAKK